METLVDIIKRTSKFDDMRYVNLCTNSVDKVLELLLSTEESYRNLNYLCSLNENVIIVKKDSVKQYIKDRDNLTFYIILKNVTDKYLTLGIKCDEHNRRGVFTIFDFNIKLSKELVDLNWKRG